MTRRLLLVVLAPLLALWPSLPARGATPPAPPSVVDLCGDAAPGQATCFGQKYVGAAPMTSTPFGYGPADLQSAYALPSSSGGIGQTVYIVDAYDNPTAEADLATYRTQYGLPACTTANGCFRKLNQTGATSPLPSFNSGWAGEISLDLDMVSAVCPNCHITLIEANDSGGGLYTAIQTAVNLGARYVSLSWGGPEYAGETQMDSIFTAVPGVLFAVSTGDSGFAGGVSYPASSAAVLAVGGTSLHPSATTRGWTETAWSGAGSGCSAYEAKPAWQAFIPGSVCTRRALADVSAVADPNSGVAVYHGGWGMYGGTSAAAPVVAAAYALAGATSTVNPASFPYSNTVHLNDVLTGSTGSCGSLLCAAAASWDGPTGLGTPAGIAGLNGAGSSTPVTTVLSGSVPPASGVAGLPIAVSVTPYVPAAATLSKVSWKAARADCTFADPAALTTTVSCNASAIGSTAISATLTDSTGVSKLVPAVLTFTTSATKRSVSARLLVDGQADSAQVCAGISVRSLAGVIDDATGMPVKGASVTFTKVPSVGLPTALGTGVTGSDGLVARSGALATATLKVQSAAVGGFSASAPVNEPVTAGRCTPVLTATADATAVGYADTVHVSGAVTRTVGAATLPIAGVPVRLTLTYPSTAVGGSTTTTFGSVTTRVDGTYAAVLHPTRSGQVRAVIDPVIGLAGTTTDVGPVTVSPWAPAITLQSSASSTTVGGRVALTGAVTKTGPAGTSAASGVRLKVLLLPSSGAAPILLGAPLTTATGAYALSAVISASGTIVTKVDGVVGYANASSAGVPISVA